MAPALPQNDLEQVLSLTPSFWPRFTGARVLITGGTGFIGNWLLQVLQQANDQLGTKLDILVLSRTPERARQNAPHIFNRADTTLVQGDVIDFKAPTGALDLCIHAATDFGNPHLAQEPLRVFDSIVEGTRRLLDHAHANGVSRFLLTSSGAIYGPQPPDLDRLAETYPGAPDTLLPSAAYGNGKRAAEWLAAAHALNSGADSGAVIARIFALIGPGMPLNGSFAAGNFLRDALQGIPIQIQGDGRPMRSYLYMADLCVWLLRILEAGNPGHAYNVGSEQALSIRELAEKISQATGSISSVQVLTPSAAGTPAPRYVPNTEKSRCNLGLAEYTPLADALRKTAQWTRTDLLP